jgi:iron-sulfur cluster assembly accessory protein
MIKEINFSKKAVEEINQLISKKPSGTFFRIAVKGGGCSGFKYDFSFDNKIDNNDLKHENIVIDKSSLDMLKGSQVDFTNELIGSSFKISNPKTKSSCGCGVSFSF